MRGMSSPSEARVVIAVDVSFVAEVPFLESRRKEGPRPGLCWSMSVLHAYSILIGFDDLRTSCLPALCGISLSRVAY